MLNKISIMHPVNKTFCILKFVLGFWTLSTPINIFYFYYFSFSSLLLSFRLFFKGTSYIYLLVLAAGISF